MFYITTRKFVVQGVMLIYILGIILTSLILIILYGLFINRILGLPNGPFPLPILGNALTLILHADDMEGKLYELYKEYGPIYTIWTPFPKIVLGSFNVIQEALVKNGEAFAGRQPGNNIMRLLAGGDYGLFFEGNEMWKEQRRFALQSLRELGYGNGDMQNKLIDFTMDAITILKEKNGEVVEMRPYFMFCVSNVIWELIFNKSLPFNDPDFHTVRTNLDQVIQLFTHPLVSFTEFHPAFAYLDPLFGGAIKHMKTSNDRVLNVIDKDVRQIEERFDPEARISCFVECYLRHMHKLKQEGLEQGTFNRHQMLWAAYDLWSGGFEATVVMLRNFVLVMINHPEVQARMHEEIDREIGGKIIRMEDQKSLPYCCAVIQELLRTRTIGPLNVPHYTLQETTIRGVNIPAGSTVLPQFQFVHRDPDEFERPSYFCPERFLNAQGEFLKDPRVTPFSSGKRACIGEGLARMELFTIATNFVQHLSFFPVGLIPPEPIQIEGFVRSPAPFKCIVRARNS